MSDTPASVLKNLLSEMAPPLSVKVLKDLINRRSRVDSAQLLHDSVRRLIQDLSCVLMVVHMKQVQLAKTNIGGSFERRTPEYKQRIRSLKEEREKLMTKVAMLKKLAKEYQEAS
jgi:uncharacterized protein YlxW (UPF0749 family)